MKRIINKTFTAVIIALTMLVALFCGLFITKTNQTADAAAPAPTVKLTADTKSFVAGGSFKLTVSIDAPGANLSAVAFYIGVLDAHYPEDGFTEFDAAKMQMLTVTNKAADPTVLAAAKYKPCRDIKNSADYVTDGYYSLQLSEINGTTGIALNNLTVFTMDVEINSNVAPGTEFVFDVSHNEDNGIRYADKTQYNGSLDSKLYISEPLTVTVTVPSDNAKLSEIKVGQGEESEANPYQELAKDENAIQPSAPLSVVINDPTAPLTVKVDSVDGVKSIIIKPANVTVSDGSADVTVSDGDTITIEVTAEDGTHKETYTINVKIVGASLTALTAVSDSTLAGVTQKDLQGTFASSTTEYDVYVPNDNDTQVTVNATISTGNSASTTANLEYTGAASGPSSQASNTDFIVTGIETGNTLKIKVTADDNNGNTAEKVYTLTFKVVDTDSDFTFEVKGKTKNKVIKSNDTKAAEASVDYYYMVAGETNAASVATVNAAASAKVKINSTESNTANLNAGTHSFTVTAEAGNSVTKSFILVNYTPLQLKAGITADFIKEEQRVQGASRINYYRRSYKELGIQHGIDDTDLDRFVIGQVLDYTTVNEFLENFTDKTKIRLYDSKDHEIWNCGSVGSFVDDEDYLDDFDEFAIGTGWRIEYVVNGTVEETIYVSVLGDLNGDGYIAPADITRIVNLVKGDTELLDMPVEQRLAGYINNRGQMNALDISIISDAIREQSDLSSYFYQG